MCNYLYLCERYYYLHYKYIELICNNISFINK